MTYGSSTFIATVTTNVSSNQANGSYTPTNTVLINVYTAYMVLYPHSAEAIVEKPEI